MINANCVSVSSSIGEECPLQNEPDGSVALFHKMLRTRPLPFIFDFTKLLSCVMKIKQYTVTLFLFDKMFQRDAPTGSLIKRCYEPDVVTFTKLINWLFSVGKISEAARLLEKLLREKLCESNEITYLILINGLWKAMHKPQ